MTDDTLDKKLERLRDPQFLDRVLRLAELDDLDVVDQAVAHAKAEQRRRIYEKEQAELRGRLLADYEAEVKRLGRLDPNERALIQARLIERYRRDFGLDSGLLSSEFQGRKQDRKRELLASLPADQIELQSKLWAEYNHELTEWRRGAGDKLSISREMMIRNAYQRKGLKFELFED